MKESAKRRKSKAQLKEEKKQEERKQAEVARKLAEYEVMKAKADAAQKVHDEKEHYRQLCDRLYNDGVIKQDEDGSIVPVEDPLERESIRSKIKGQPMTESKHGDTQSDQFEFVDQI